MSKSNKGFSLIELIIVIAIMAILVGVMAPQLIKYIEKTKVSADLQYLDGLHTAFLTAYSDPEVVTSTNSTNNNIINNYFGGGVVHLNSAGGNVPFTKAVLDIVGEPNITVTMQSYGNNIKDHFRSKGAHANGYVYLCYENGTLYMWINGSDITGEGGSYTCNSVSDLETSKVIYVK